MSPIGPIGVTGRAIAGVVLIVVTIAGPGLRAWDLVGALVVLPALSIALHRLLTFGVHTAGVPPRPNASPNAVPTWVINLGALVLIIGIGTALTFLTPINAGAIWLFFGISLLVVAARGDAGCEALAISNALAGHRERTGCIAFAPIDLLEARRATPVR
jgi:hypothetical protein